MFSYISLETRIPKEHLLRPIRKMVEGISENMGKEFSQMYSGTDRASIPLA
jgi:hypothetical protein